MIDTILNNSWDEVLTDEFHDPNIIKLLNWLDREYENENKKIFPSKENLFNSLKLTPYNNVKVVILGQDPYHAVDKNGNRHAHGLSFSSLSIYEIPKSLLNIFKELNSDVGITMPKHSNLTKWAEQGVLLLNTVLSVEAGKANSHKGIGWEDFFTSSIIQKLGNNENPIVFILWGEQAKKYKKYIKGSNKLILESAHPSPLSAYRGFFGCKHFSQTNDFLIEHGLQPIDWQI